MKPSKPIRLLRRLAVGVLASLAIAPAALAQAWVVVDAARGEATVEMDVASVVLDEASVRSWTRQTFPRPVRVEKGSASRIVALRIDDCRGRYAYGMTTWYDARGAVVMNTEAPSTPEWRAVERGSVSEALGRAACGLAAAEESDDVRTGDWKALGKSEDKPEDRYALFVAMDDIAVGENGMRMAFIRSEYDYYQFIDDVPFRYTLRNVLVDCTGRRVADGSTLFFSTPTRIVSELDVEADDLEFTPAAPGTFAYKLLEPVCSAQGAPARARGEEASPGGFATGTAWATTKGYLVTSAHVIAGARSIAVTQDGEKLGEATVVVADQANDLAVLRFNPPQGRRLTIIPLADRPAALGRPVFTLGFPSPGTMGQRIKMTSGEVSSTAGIRDDARFLQISASVQPGNSGGPLMTYDGAAVGVVASKLTTLGGQGAPAPENVNYAVKVAYLRPLLEELPDLGNHQPMAAGGTVEELIARTQASVFLLVVTK